MSDEGFKRSFRNMGLQRGEWEEPKMTKTPDDAAAEEREGYRRWYESQYPDRVEAARLRVEIEQVRAENAELRKRLAAADEAIRYLAKPDGPSLTPGRTEDLAHGGWKPPDPYRPD